MTPNLSVVVPTYNRAKEVTQAIQSILAQNTPDTEIIVVDDGSTDNTGEVLRHTFGSSIRLIEQPNSGPSSARNRGIIAAKGRWIAFLDSDDLWLPGKIALQLAETSRHPTAVAHMVDAQIEGQNLTLFELRSFLPTSRTTPLRVRPLADVLKVQFFTPTWLVRTDAVRRSGTFREDMRIYEDFEFLTRLALQGPFVVSPYPGVLVRRIANDVAALSNQHLTATETSLRNLVAIYSQLLARQGLERSEKLNLRRQLGGVFFELSCRDWANGRRSQSLRQLIAGTYADPGPVSILRALVATTLGSEVWHYLSRRVKGSAPRMRRSDVP